MSGAIDTTAKHLVQKVTELVFEACCYNMSATTVAKTVAHGIPYFTKTSDRTIIADVQHWKPKGRSRTFTFVDLGGHVSYRNSGHFFFVNSKSSISVVVHDITSSDYDDSLWWFKSNLTKAPQSQVVIVLSKIDMIEDKKERQEKIDRFKTKLRAFLQKEIKSISKTVKRVRKSDNKSSRLSRFEDTLKRYGELEGSLDSFIFPVSCEMEFEHTIEALKNHLMELADRPENQVILTEEECDLYLKIGLLGIVDNMTWNPVGYYEQLGKSSRNTSSNTAGLSQTERCESPKPENTSFLHLEDVVTWYREIHEKKGLLTDDMKTKTKKALANLHYHGLVMYYLGDPVLENVVFHNIKQLIKLLEVIFHHELTDELKNKFQECGDIYDDQLNQFKNDLANLKKNGVMSTNLLRSRLRESKCDIDSTVVLRLLQQLEVGFPYKPDGHDEEQIFVPFFIRLPAQEEYLNKRKSEMLEFNSKTLSLHGVLRGDLTDTFFNFLIVRMQKEIHKIDRFLKTTEQWNNCFCVELVEHKMKMMLFLNKQNEVEFYFHSETNTVDAHRIMWDFIRKLHGEQDTLMVNWCPGLVYEIILFCSICRIHMNEHPCETDLNRILIDREGVDRYVCEQMSSERHPRGMMFPLSKGEEAAKQELESLLQYLSKKTAVTKVKVSKSTKVLQKGEKLPIQETAPAEEPHLSTSSTQEQHHGLAGGATGTQQHGGARQKEYTPRMRATSGQPHQSAHQEEKFPIQETAPAEEPHLSTSSTQEQHHGLAGGATGTQQHGGARPKEYTPRMRTTSGQPHQSAHQEEAKMTITVKECTHEYAHHLLNTTDVYRMSKRSRGRALIVDIHKFGNPRDYRHGSCYDATNLQELFKQLHFETQLEENPNKMKLESLLWEERHRDSHKDAEAFILCILSHGGNIQHQDYILTSDDQQIRVRHDICAQFDGKQCPHLEEKPKVFFIQACRGDKYAELVPDQVEEADARYERETPEKQIHVLADTLIANATVPGEVSLRDKERGSTFVRTIVNVFQDQAHCSHLVDMLTQVRAQVAAQKFNVRAETMGPREHVQLPEDYNTLTKKLYFFPGYPAP